MVFDMAVIQVTILLLLWRICGTNDILGCGGYVKSDVEINFSQIFIKLYTKEGNLKFETDCAPNNGYYFIPVYDKGNYVIRVSPPHGWSFEPDELAVNIDGETDACSLGQDINFNFKGFAVIGKVVSFGSDTGPVGVSVSLYKKDTLILTTETGLGGSYVFTPLSSGKYFVVASHPVWRFTQDKVAVDVNDSNGDVGSSLVVAGYHISGLVTTEGHPTSGVFVVLHSKGKSDNIQGCTKGAPKGYISTSSSPVICHAVTNPSGSFAFHSVSPGMYTLVPFHRVGPTLYEVVPSELPVRVDHGDVNVGEAFKVAGFSIVGRVLTSSGIGISAASVVLDGVTKSVTDKEGKYSFEKVKLGVHKLIAYADLMEFDEISFEISTNQPMSPDLTPARFQVCFQVTLDASANSDKLWKILLKKGDTVLYPIQTDVKGYVCKMLPKGSYLASVQLSEVDAATGIRFGPSEHEFIVNEKPILELEFAQFLGEIIGTVNCLQGECPVVPVVLRDKKGEVVQKGVAKGGSFTFKQVLPGIYNVSVAKEDWCWGQEWVEVRVSGRDVQVGLSQSGFALTVVSTHSTQLIYARVGNDSKEMQLAVTAGTTRTCVSEVGVYVLGTKGCHRFSQSVAQWNTGNPAPVSLSATHHQLSGTVISQEKGSFTIIVKGDGKQETILGPLNAATSDGTHYEFVHWTRGGEGITLVPRDRDSLFQYRPSKHAITMPDDCLLNAVIFEAQKALFLKGQVMPPLAGVSVTISGGDAPFVTVTDAQGKYQVGPLDSSLKYSVSAEKKSFILTPSPGKDGDFTAYKLAEISVLVTDESNHPLPGVLISISGGENFRQNNLTEANGGISFLSLSPGEYFLRPVMKEYSFEPTSRMVLVEEGKTVDIVFRSSRVAFSIYVQTLSLNGEIESEVTIEAVGIGQDCLQYQEEALSDGNGMLRIRGLLPKCNYDLQLKQSHGVNQYVHRSLPRSREIHIENGDLRDVKVIVVRHFPQMDIVGHVDCSEPSHLSSLTARLYRDDSPEVAIASVRLSSLPFFMLAPMIKDGRSYTVRLESNLATSQYHYSSSEVSFLADVSFKRLVLPFNARLKGGEAEMMHSSMAGLAIAVILCISAFAYGQMGPFLELVSGLVSSVTTRCSSPTPSSSTSDSPIIENLRKRAKARKV